MKNSVGSPYIILSLLKRVISLVGSGLTLKKWVILMQDNMQLRMKKYMVKTEDGSFTIARKGRDQDSETMHTSHGAVVENQIKYVNPLRIDGKKTLKYLIFAQDWVSMQQLHWKNSLIIRVNSN